MYQVHYKKETLHDTKNEVYETYETFRDTYLKYLMGRRHFVISIQSIPMGGYTLWYLYNVYHG